jgi:hypothetical protein
MANSEKGPGLLSIVLGVILLWAVFFGVTCGSTHYRINCTPDNGVKIDSDPSKSDAVPSAGPPIPTTIPTTIPTATTPKPTRGIIYQ